MSSLWHETAVLPSFPSLNENIKADVLIIGGGMAGMLTSFLLKEKGISSVVLESGKICSGTTGNTTAKITFQHGLIYSELIKKGAETAKAYYETNRLALEKYRELSKNIKCDFEIKDNYIYSTDSRQKIEDELNALHIIGAEGSFSERLSLPFSTVGAVKTENQAQFHPLLFISEIAKILNVYENSRVIEMKGNTAVTEKGSVKAENVIVATHFPFINKHGLYSLKLYQHRSYVIALDNAEEIGGMYLDEKEKGLSFRNYRNLLLLGGGDHRTGKKGGSYTELRRKANLFYPKAQEKFRWAAQDCMSLDSMPYIGSYSKSTHKLFTLTGFNKWGMTGAMWGAMLLSDLITGKKNPYAEIFSPSRSMLTPQIFVNGAESLLGYLYPTAKRCPHLGCALRYNKAEHSWDCPCHGSRFTENGRVLDGPANGNLK
ncbi:MAG: FAD-dependent oxidoreductase [Clostridia bacterium]|nr:FAD-dependent oxidoreductase [Clostridia bacterium]